MKSTAFQVIFAEDWLAKVWIGGFVVAAIAALITYLFPAFSVLGFSVSSVALVFAILFGGLIAYFVSLILGSCILPPVCRIRERLNGAPFETGDVVVILKKPHRGRMAWIDSSRNTQYGASVRFIDSGVDAESLNIAWHSIRRLTQTEQDSGGNGGQRL
jgi:hypothetical protein